MGQKRKAIAVVATLRQELLANEEYLQSTIEELETSNEELNSSNEEMQSINEELQSSNEELETSKEELQSVNEELSTVNTELQNKLTDLVAGQQRHEQPAFRHGHRDHIRGPSAVHHALHPGRDTDHQPDPGRHRASLRTHRFQDGGLRQPRRRCARGSGHIDSKELEVQTGEGKWYALRIQPYRTIENVIEGAVITFVDITEMKKSHELLHKAHDQIRLAGVVRDSQDAIAAVNMDGDILSWNPAAQRLFAGAKRRR